MSWCPTAPASRGAPDSMCGGLSSKPTRARRGPKSRARLHPQAQYWIEDSHGRLARADLAFPEHKVAVEYDGSWRDGELWALNRVRDRLAAAQPHPHGPNSPRRTQSTTPVSAFGSEWRLGTGYRATGRAGVLGLL